MPQNWTRPCSLARPSNPVTPTHRQTPVPGRRITSVGAFRTWNLKHCAHQEEVKMGKGCASVFGWCSTRDCSIITLGAYRNVWQCQRVETRPASGHQGLEHENLINIRLSVPLSAPHHLVASSSRWLHRAPTTASVHPQHPPIPGTFHGG
jgi:hypothetical protein